MSYIIKKNEPLINLKLTDIARRNLSAGSLSFTDFILGDGEMDYSSNNPLNVNILRPVDNQHEIQYRVPYENETYLRPISLITPTQTEISDTAKERGFFNYNNGLTVELNSDLWLAGNLIGIPQTDRTKLSLGVTLETTTNNYKTTINVGDLLFVKIKTFEYIENYQPINLANNLVGDPIPYLMYVIKDIEGSDSYNLADLVTGTTTGVTTGAITGITTGITSGVTVNLDRSLPNFSGYIVDAFIYPGGDAIKDHYDNETPIAYWSGGLLDFTSNCTLSNDDTPVWNMNIVTIEDIIGVDNILYKNKSNATSKNYWGTAINYDYLLNKNYKIGVIHYTNNSVSNYYGEGFYKNTFKLKLPYIMWHKKQFGGVSLGDEIGYTFVCADELKTTGNENYSIRYYDLVDQETNPTVVGKVLIDQKIVIIEDQELLSVMSYKSNRNWTLPTPKLTLTEPGVCVGASTIGSLLDEEQLHISYVFLDSEGITGMQCENFTTITNNTGTPKDVIFEFPKSNTDPNYSEFSYLKDFTSTDGYGFRVGTVLLLWQKTPDGFIPAANNWNYININNFIGTGGCVTNVIDTCDSFELTNETTIYPTSFTSNQYTLSQEEIGEVIVSLNGLILKQATSIDNLGVDGDYYKYPKNVLSGLNNTSVIEFTNNLLQSSDVIQFHYLIGETNTSSTIREDFDIPATGVPISNTYEDGIYILNGKVCLTLNKQPNNNVVYLFYNGQLISSNNYGVIPTGTTQDRRVELNFTPITNSTVSLFYLDSAGLGNNPISTVLTAKNIENLRVNIDKRILDISEDTNYDLNDFISIPTIANINEHSFGDETFFFGNVETDIKATIYKSLITCNILPNKYISSSNPTFNPDQDKVAFTEMGVYDNNGDLVAIGKFSQPITRKYNSDVLIIQATIDF